MWVCLLDFLDKATTDVENFVDTGTCDCIKDYIQGSLVINPVYHALRIAFWFWHQADTMPGANDDCFHEVVYTFIRRLKMSMI